MNTFIQAARDRMSAHRAAQLSTWLTDLRRQLHANPELSWHETETARRCGAILEELGFTLRLGLATTGLVADIGSAGPLVVIRADMDALPIQTCLQAEYASVHPGCMHACGHDAHMAMTLGAARILAELNHQGLLRGRVRILLQPSEESEDADGKSGAQRMIEEGACDGAIAAIAQHCMPDVPAGKVFIPDGPVMAAGTPFEIQIEGNGGHVADATSLDTILIGCRIRCAIQEALAENGWVGKIVVGIGRFEPSSSAPNVLPRTVTIGGGIRSFDDGLQAECKRLVQRIAQRECRLVGAACRVTFNADLPVTENAPHLAAIMRDAVLGLLGDNALHEMEVPFTAEDFAFYKHVVPTVFMLIGTGIAGQPRKLHTPDFDLPEEVLPFGSAILAETALRIISAQS